MKGFFSFTVNTIYERETSAGYGGGHLDKFITSKSA